VPALEIDWSTLPRADCSPAYAGIAVNIAARVESHAGTGQLLVSHTVRDMLICTDHSFTNQGERELKGIEGAWHLHSLDAKT
jgi:class 3 adenylate cyclase